MSSEQPAPTAGAALPTPTLLSPSALSASAKSALPTLLCIIVQSALSALLIPLFLFLVCSSTRELRRTLVFYLNLVAICLGLATGILSLYIDMATILYPLEPFNRHVLLADAIIATCIPLFIQFILLWRLYAVYRPRWTPCRLVYLIWVPPVVLMVTRIVNITVTMRIVARLFLTEASVLAASEASWTAKGTRIEMFLQIFDNTYISVLFLSKIRTAASFGDSKHALAPTRPRPAARRLQMLFWSAATNFVFPVLLNAAQLAFIYASSDYGAAVYMTTLFFVNDIVQIVCSVLATLWVAVSRRWDPAPSASASGPWRATLSGAGPAADLEQTQTESQRTEPRDSHTAVC